MRAFRVGFASRSMTASKPSPHMITNRSAPPSRMPTSRSRRSPCSATSSAPARSWGRSRLSARRLPVPPRRTARGTPLPARPVTQAITVPSPPAARTRSTPCSTARRVRPWPGSCLVVSSHTTSTRAASSAARRSRLRSGAPSGEVAGLNTTATRRTADGRVAAGWAAGRSAMARQRPPPDRLPQILPPAVSVRSSSWRTPRRMPSTLNARRPSLAARPRAHRWGRVQCPGACATAPPPPGGPMVVPAVYQGEPSPASQGQRRAPSGRATLP